MPRAMFDDVVERSVKVGTKQWYTVPLSIAVHTIAAVVFVIVPLMASDVLPTPPSMIIFVPVTSTPPPPPPPPPQRVAAAPTEPIDHPNAAPVAPPSEIRPEAPRAVESAPLASVVNGLGDALDIGLVPPPPPPTVPTPPSAPIRIGGLYQAPTRVKFVAPAYPSIALLSHVQGIVIIEATIGANGKVEDARVLRSVQLLDAAALDAVRQWEYAPTLLNGVPVPVIMTVTVTFTIPR